MATLEELVVRIRADATQLEREMKRAGQVTEQAGKKIRSEFSAVGAAIKSYLGFQTARGIVQMADSWTMLQGKIRLVTDNVAELNAANERLFAIAQATRTDLAATATLYQRVALAANRLGIEQEQIYLFTEQLNKQLVLGGLSSAEAASGILQLTQAINKGTLNGDEFRTVLETMPLVMEAIERQTGRTRGEILAMSEAGQLTARVIVDAINGMAEETNARFEELPQTFDQALQKLENAFTKFIGENSLIAGYVTNLAYGLEGISKIINDVGDGIDYLGGQMSGRNDYLEKAAAGGFATEATFLKPGQAGTEIDAALRAQGLPGFSPAARRSGGGGGTAGGKKSARAKEAQDYDEATDALSQYISQQERELELAGLTGKALEMRRAELEAGNAAMRDGNLLTEEMRQAARDNAAAIYEAAEATEALNKAQEEAIRFQAELKDKFSDTLSSIILDFDNAADAAKRFAEAVAQMIIEKRITGPLADALGGAIDSSGIGGSIGDFFGGFFADGGRPPMGRVSVVGEDGPELFVPDSRGTIIPNNQLGGGMTFHQTINISPGIQGTVRTELMQAIPGIVKASKDAVIAATQKGGSDARLLGRRG